jgi:hypothetical protein
MASLHAPSLYSLHSTISIASPRPNKISPGCNGSLDDLLWQEIHDFLKLHGKTAIEPADQQQLYEEVNLKRREKLSTTEASPVFPFPLTLPNEAYVHYVVDN